MESYLLFLIYLKTRKNLNKRKETRSSVNKRNGDAHTEPIPYQFNKWNCQVFINIEKIEKYKIMFKIRII